MSLGTKLPKLVYCDSGGQGVTSPLLWTPPQGPLRLGASGEGLQGGRGEAAAEPQGPRAPRRNSRAHAVPWSDHRVQGESESSLAPANHRVQAGRRGGRSKPHAQREVPQALTSLSVHVHVCASRGFYSVLICFHKEGAF